MLNNKDLFETLHTDHHARVSQMCCGFMKNDTALAADLTQEVFINIWRSLEKFKGASSYKTWIYRITVNTCLKYIRDHKEKKQVSIDEHLLDESEPEQTRDHQPLYSAIGKLKELDRLIIMMVLDELEYEEIAKIVGLSEGNIRVKIHRIKKELKKIIQNG
ncbi:MAG: RNA polymerase sigma factor [Ekhidna sp.]|nr:RNA polymerase sigma factor [Ekhidna sp.]